MTENPEEGVEPQETERHRPDMVWYLSCVLIVATAAFLRFFWLSLKPLHHDEGVNGWFLTNLYRDGTYKYDPANYHGPTLYYISLAFAKVFGLSTFSIRASVAVWGVAIVVLAFFLRKYIGRLGSLFAALFLALSPGMVYISRYFIHEMFFVFLSFGIVIAVLSFIEKRRAGPFAMAWTGLLLLVSFFPSTLKLAVVLTSILQLMHIVADSNDKAQLLFAGGFFIVEVILIFLVIKMLLSWNNGRPIYLLLAAACASLMFATKETAFITLGTMAIACVCVWLWRRIFRVTDLPDEEEEIRDSHLTFANFRTALGSRIDVLLIVTASALVFIYLCVLFFSSFFTYFDGVRGAIEAYEIWTKTGSKDHTQNGEWAYLKWGLASEGPIFFLSAVGILLSFVISKHRFAMFASLWAFGLFAAYTIIPYKTPWLAISFLVPMCIAAGYAINETAGAKNLSLKLLGILLALAATITLAYQTYELNFVNYDSEDEPYVYAHTSREILDLMQQISYYSLKSGKELNAKIEIVSPDYWPMVWYLRGYKQANFHGHLVDTSDSEMIVAKKNEQDQEVIRRYGARYLLIGQYHLRSGVDLVLLVRKDLADPGAEEVYRLTGTK